MWISVDKEDGDLIVCGQDRYFLVSDAEKGSFFAPAQCSHRGGPLNFGKATKKRSCIECPWHKMATPIAALERRSLTAMRCGSNWVVELPDSEHPVVVMPNLGVSKTQDAGVLRQQCQ